LRPERCRGAREQLGVGGDLRMDLEANHDLPFAGFALDAVFRHLPFLHVSPQEAETQCGAARGRYGPPLSRERAARSPPFLSPSREARALLDREPGVEHALLVERLADNLQP